MCLFDQLFEGVYFKRPHLCLGRLVDARQLADARFLAVFVDPQVILPLFGPFLLVLFLHQPVMFLAGDGCRRSFRDIDHVLETRPARFGGQFMVLDGLVEEVHKRLFGLVVVGAEFSQYVGFYFSC